MSDVIIVEFTPRKDEGCLGLKYDHYTFSNHRAPINGGFYIEKGQPVPDQIILNIKDMPKEV